MARLKRQRTLLLVVLLVATMSAGAYAHRGFFRWWRLPAEPIQDVDFTLQSSRSLLYQLVFDGTGPATRTLTELEGEVPASVVGGQLIIPTFELTDADTTVVVSVTLNDGEPINMVNTFHGGIFLAQGEASVNGADPIPVYINGSIFKRFGEYRFRASLRGFDNTQVDSTTTITLLRSCLTGTTAVPVDEPE